jgi:hypothetical protein
MKHCLSIMATTLLLVAAMSLPVYGQGAGSSLTGLVVDASGAVIPGADVVVKSDATGSEYKTVTAENGTFTVPALNAGTYTATVSMPRFKQSIIKDIVLVLGVPADVKIVLQVGGSTESVTVVAGAEVVQSTSATVSTTMSTTQVVNLPLMTRNSLDFLVFLPGANTTGSARDTTFMGIANSFVNITVDGINTQDNYNRTSDGFYTMITARPDSIQEVTLTTAAAGADSSGGGAIQVKFVTRSGDNAYHGSLYDYERNSGLNANYWFNNRDQAPVYYGSGPGRGKNCTPQQLATEWDNCKAPNTRIILHQAGGRIGGPITIPGIFHGKDKAFFFLNLEEFYMPTSSIRTNTVYTPATEQGIYTYLYKQSGQPDQVKTVDLFGVASAYGQTSTIDPTVKKILADVRNSLSKTGSLSSYPIVTDPLYQQYVWQYKGLEKRTYMTTRFDVNLTNRHRIEVSFNGETRLRDPDFLNSVGPRYPDFPNQGNTTQNRGMASFALRSTISPRIANEARGGFTMGTTLFDPNTPMTVANGSGGIGDMGGYFWGYYGMTGISPVSQPSRRNAPVKSFEDTLSWSHGAHNLSFGGNFQHVGSWQWYQTIAPSMSFGLPSAYDPAYVMFDSTNGPKNFPNATSSQYATAAPGLYAMLTARVTSISASALINENTNKYTFDGPINDRSSQNSMGLFIQDSWRMRPNFTFTYGARWEVDFPWAPQNNAYTWATPAMAWGPSGINSLFKPGATGGVPTVVNKYNPGDPAYNVDYKAIAPSVGFAWSPNVKGLLGKLIGEGSQTVLRGGFSIAYNHYGTYTYDSMFASNPGGTIDASRSQTLGNLIAGNGPSGAARTYPVLFRDRVTDTHLLDPPPFLSSPTFPLAVTYNNSINAFEPDIRTPYTLSWSFGVQRELTKDMALEVRYAATRNEQPWFQRNLNETNVVENGWLKEFRLAQANLYANVAAGKGKTFRYDASVPGTSPLPITIAYLGGKIDPTVSNNYTTAVLGSSQSGVFTNSTYVNYLNTYAPAAGSLASVFYGDATRRSNALAAGLPANFFMVNPDVQGGGAWIYKNGGGNIYDSMVIELRRRMAKGLLVQGSYTWAKAYNINQLSWRRDWVKDVGGTLPSALKLNWVYELPVGQGRTFFSGAGKAVDRVIGGWELQGTGRMQSGNLQDLGNVNLVGMTDQDLKNSVGLWYDDINKKVNYLPKDFTTQSYYAYQYDTTGFTSGAPTGRYVAPAGSVNGGNCYQVVTGDCAPRHHYFRGPGFTRFDLSLVKRIRFSENKNFELRGEFLNAFNNINFGTANTTGSSLSFGQITSAYTDQSNSQDPGGRLIQIVMRINF